MRKRLQEFALSLHSEKTPADRVWTLSRWKTASGAGSANRRPSPSWASPSSAAKLVGKFQIKRKSRRDRCRQSCKPSNRNCDGAFNVSRSPQGRWLQQVVTGYFNYHAVPTNSSTLTAFLFHVTNLWRRATAVERESWTVEVHQAVGRRLAPETANPSSVARELLRR